jgi:hypothetical protein
VKEDNMERGERADYERDARRWVMIDGIDPAAAIIWKLMTHEDPKGEIGLSMGILSTPPSRTSTTRV